MKLGFIGAGNMASAIMKGIISTGLYSKDEIIAADLSDDARNKAKNELGVSVTVSNQEAAKEVEILILAIKPFHFQEVIEEIRPVIKDDVLVISIAAGQTISNIEKLFGKDIHLVRTMPNTPALVGAGAAGLCRNSLVTEEELKKAVAIFESFGIAEVVPESMIDAVIGVSGSSPAYVFMFIEAMADAAVADGMPRAQAYRFAAQAVLGSAKMVLETGKHPGELKDMVWSPSPSNVSLATTTKSSFGRTQFGPSLISRSATTKSGFRIHCLPPTTGCGCSKTR